MPLNSTFVSISVLESLSLLILGGDSEETGTYIPSIGSSMSSEIL